MAAKTPAAVGTTGYVDPTRGLYIGPLASTEDYLADGTYTNKRLQYTLRIVYFADIDDGDTWASGIPGIVACAFQGNEAPANTTVVQATAAADGTVTFRAETANSLGWLWMLIDDPNGTYGVRLS